MSPTRRRHRRYHGQNFLRRRKVQDRVRENSVVKTFGPLSRSFSFELPKIVVQSDDTNTTEELDVLRQSKSTQDLSVSDAKHNTTTEDNTSGSEQSSSNTADRHGWNSDTIKRRLLKSIAKREGNKVTLLVPLVPLYGPPGGTTDISGDAIRSWIRTNTRGSRWYTPEMAARYLASPFRSVATQTDPIIKVTASSSSSTPSKGLSGNPSPSHHPPSPSPSCRWDRLVDMEWNGTRVSHFTTRTAHHTLECKVFFSPSLSLSLSHSFSLLTYITYTEISFG